MDLSKIASYITLDPSQLIRAERSVEQGLNMYNMDEELTQAYLKEHLGGKTLEYALQILDENTTSYMGVQIHNQNGAFSAPTAGVYNMKSRPELKAKVKEKVLKRNERENKAERKEEVEVVEEGSLKQARKNVGASTCWKGYKAKGTKTKNGKSVPNCVKEEEVTEESKGLYANIHAKRKRGESPAKPGDKDYPAKGAFKQAAKTAKEEVELDELYKGKHGQSEKEYQDGRSQGGKMVSGDSKMSGAKYTHGRRVSDGGAGPQPAGGSKKPAAQGRMDSGTRNDLKYRKANLMKKEEVVNEEGADAMKDRRMERGGVDGNNRYNKAPGKPNLAGKKPSSGMSAFDKVVADLKSKHGDKAIMAKKTMKKESMEDLEEKKMSKAAHKKAAKAGKRWQDSDGDGKWYEPGQDVKKEDFNLNDQEYDFLYHQFVSEGFESDEIIEALNESIEEAKVTYGHDTEGPAKKPSATKSFLSKVGKMAKAKLAKAQVKGYNKAREVGQAASDKVKQVKQSAKNKIGRTARKIADRMGEEVELDEASVEIKGKKKGNVIINPEVKKVNEDADTNKGMQIQKRQLMLNKQKIALQQRATSKKQTTDMHTEENLQEVDTTTRAVQYGAEIENTALKRKKEKKSLKTFKQLAKGE